MMPNHSFPTSWRRWSRLMTGWVLVALIGALLPVPLAGQPLCPFDQVWDAEAEACVPMEPTGEPAAAPTDEPTLEPTVALEPTTEPTDPEVTVPPVAEPTVATIDEGDITETEPGVTVDLVVWECPQDVVDNAINAYEDLVFLCGPAEGEMEMQILSADGISSAFTIMGQTPTMEVAPGTVQVRQFTPEGYDVTLVMCTITGTNPDGQIEMLQEREELDAEGYATVEDLPPAANLVCEFFNLPETPATEAADDTGSTPEMTDEAPDADGTPGVDGADRFFLTDWLEDAFDAIADFLLPGFSVSLLPEHGIYMIKVLCDGQLSATSTIEQLHAQCPHDGSGIQYDYIFDTGLTVSMTPTLVTEKSEVSLPDTYATIAIRNLGTEILDPPMVSCIMLADRDDDTPVWVMPPTRARHAAGGAANESFVQLNSRIVPNGVLVCEFFHPYTPNPPITVDMIAYVCPEEVVANNISFYNDLILLCGLPGSEVQMQVNTGTIRTRQTVNGVATFTDLPAGDVKVRQRVPTGYDFPFVYCIVTANDGRVIKQRDFEIIGNFQYVTIPAVPPGAHVLCEYFNRPNLPAGSLEGPPRTWRREDPAALAHRRMYGA